MRERIVAGNWKMNGDRALVEAFSAALPALAGDAVTVALFPPATLLRQAADALSASDVVVGAQTVHAHASGAFTGETSAAMVVDAGGTWTLVGHSERRALFGEDDAAVAARFLAAREAGLRPVLCVGETLEQRQAGQARETVLGQLRAVTDAAGTGFAGAVVAYEPVWAIGTGEVATPEQAQEMHAAIRAALGAAEAGLESTPVLYGGSVNGDNAAGLFAQPDIDGALVGGASLKTEEFARIVIARGH